MMAKITHFMTFAGFNVWVTACHH